MFFFTESILKNANGDNYIGVLLATQYTWSLTSFTGFWAYRAKNHRDYAKALFFYLQQRSEMGPYAFSFLGIAYSQYLRAIDGTTLFLSSSNFWGMTAAVFWSFTQMFIQSLMKAVLCHNHYSSTCD